jgi:hypothetical protein
MKEYSKALILILICLAILIPFVSSNPDGLEKVAETFGIEETESTYTGLIPDYTVSIIENSYVSNLVAGILGVFLVLGATIVLGMMIKKPKK